MAQMGKHPMLEEIAQALEHGPDTALVFSPEVLRGFSRRALAITAGAELYELVGDLVSFATFLSTRKGSPTAAQALITMAEPLMTRVEELAALDRAQLGVDNGELRRRLEHEKRALGGSPGAQEALGPRPSGGVRLRRSR